MRDSPSFLTIEFGKKAWLLQSDANVRNTDQKSIRGLSPSSTRKKGGISDRCSRRKLSGNFLMEREGKKNTFSPFGEEGAFLRLTTLEELCPGCFSFSSALINKEGKKARAKQNNKEPTFLACSLDPTPLTKETPHSSVGQSRCWHSSPRLFLGSLRGRGGRSETFSLLSLSRSLTFP